jgi:hypothetical protein
MTTRRVVIDNCSLHPFVQVPGAYEAARRAIDSGDLEILYTHVSLEEASATRDPELRKSLVHALTTLGRPVPTGAFILDLSWLDHARITDASGTATVEALRSNAVQHSIDALVAITAQVEGCALLTEEKKRLPRRARDEGIEVLDCTQLFAEIGFAPGAVPMTPAPRTQ